MAMNAAKNYFMTVHEALIQGFSDGVIAFDHDLRYTVFNPAMEVMTGIRASAALGRKASEVFPFLEETGEIQNFRKALKGEFISIEARPFFIPSVGKTVYFESKFSPIFDPVGAVMGGMSIIRDVTDVVLEERKLSGDLVREFSEIRFRQLIEQTLERSRLYEREREAREKAESERSRIFSVLQQIPVAVAVSHGPEHRLVFANPMYMSAVQGKEILGKPLREAHPELVEQGIVAATDEVFRTGIPFSSTEQEVRLYGRDGKSQIRYFNGNLIPWRNELGEIEGVLNFSFDVTEHVLQRRRAAESEARLTLAVESAKIGLWELNCQTGKVLRNAYSDEAFGFDRAKEAITFEDFIEKVHPEDRVKAAEGVNSGGIEKNDVTLEYRILRPDGSVRWLLSKMWIQRDAAGMVVNANGAIVDITHLKETELALVRAKEEAEVANRAKTVFVANMSHEFRTPLCAILGFADFLGRENLSLEKRASYVDGINRNGNALVKLLEDILDLSRVEAGQFTLEMSEFDSRMLMSDVVGLFQSEAIRKGIALSFRQEPDCDGTIASDPVRVRQILINLIGNAVKFTSKGKVEVVMRRDQQDASIAEFFVTDTGVGLNDESRARIFQPFSQGDTSTARKFGGTGLGLVISRRLAQALGGDVELIDSEPKRGSTFLLRVRDHSKEPGSNIANEGSSGSASALGTKPKSTLIKGLRVLIVEDTRDLQVLIQEYLEERGVAADLAMDGREGVDKIIGSNALKYDLVLMDLHMPNLDGYGAVQELRASSYTGLIYALTAKALPEDRRRCMEMGFDGFLVKPLQFDELERALGLAMRAKPAR